MSNEGAALWESKGYCEGRGRPVLSWSLAPAWNTWYTCNLLEDSHVYRTNYMVDVLRNEIGQAGPVS